MIKQFTKTAGIFLFITILFSGCGEKQQEQEEIVEDAEVEESPIDFPLSQAERDALTPEDVIQEFKEGNILFTKDSLTERNRKARMEKTALNQYPKAMIVSCIDSRVPAEEVFNQSIGDVFVGRIAGNFVDTEMLGSIEYATKVAGSKVVVIMGHEGCGAVKSAIAKVELGNITELLDHIEPAVEMTTDYPEEERTLKNEDFVKQVIVNNVLYNLQQTRNNSPIIAEMEQNGEIELVGAYYDISTGEVQFIEETK